MLQADEPDDFVLATGGNFTVRDFVVTAFEHAGLDKLGWVPKVHTDELARIMVDADIEALKREGRAWIDRCTLDAWPTPGVAG